MGLGLFTGDSTGQPSTWEKKDPLCQGGRAMPVIGERVSEDKLRVFSFKMGL